MAKSNNLISPITKGPVKFLFDISSKSIIESYIKEANIDVSYLLQDIDTISVYECAETGYRFFSPFDVAGDGPFYEKLEHLSWYYAEWKWDYDIANKFIIPNSTVLDIGCGEGKFLDYLTKSKGCDCTGLELNEKAQSLAIENGIVVYNQLIQDYALENKNKYDVVTFFQVLEHISNVDAFLKAAIATVKTGGKIILAVPNNEPFYLTFDKNHFLNLPPHHMGWWNQKSLSSLANLYGVRLDHIVKQPLEHYSAYTHSFIKEKMSSMRFLHLLFYPILKIIFFLNRKKINGASILAVYTKI